MSMSKYISVLTDVQMPCLSIILSAQVYFFRSEVDLLKNLKKGILLEGDTKMR